MAEDNPLPGIVVDSDDQAPDAPQAPPSAPSPLSHAFRDPFTELLKGTYDRSQPGDLAPLPHPYLPSPGGLGSYTLPDTPEAASEHFFEGPHRPEDPVSPSYEAAQDAWQRAREDPTIAGKISAMGPVANAALWGLLGARAGKGSGSAEEMPEPNNQPNNQQVWRYGREAGREIGPLGFYSEGLAAANGLLRKSGPMAGFYKDMQRSGISSNELSGLGLTKWQGNQTPTTSEELIATIRQNLPNLTEDLYQGVEPAQPEDNFIVRALGKIFSRTTGENNIPSDAAGPALWSNWYWNPRDNPTYNERVIRDANVTDDSGDSWVRAPLTKAQLGGGHMPGYGQIVHSRSSTERGPNGEPYWLTGEWQPDPFQLWNKWMQITNASPGTKEAEIKALIDKRAELSDERNRVAYGGDAVTDNGYKSYDDMVYDIAGKTYGRSGDSSLRDPTTGQILAPDDKLAKWAAGIYGNTNPSWRDQPVWKEYLGNPAESDGPNAWRKNLGAAAGKRLFYASGNRDQAISSLQGDIDDLKAQQDARPWYERAYDAADNLFTEPKYRDAAGRKIAEDQNLIEILHQGAEDQPKTLGDYYDMLTSAKSNMERGRLLSEEINQLDNRLAGLGYQQQYKQQEPWKSEFFQPGGNAPYKMAARRALILATKQGAEGIAIPTAEAMRQLGMGGKQSGMRAYYDDLYPALMQAELQRLDPSGGTVRSTGNLQPRDPGAYKDVGAKSMTLFKLSDKAKAQIAKGLPYPYRGGGDVEDPLAQYDKEPE